MDKDRALKTAFVIASKDGQTEIVELLLEAGVDVHLWEDVALRCAADNGQTETVRFLLSKGADAHAMEDEALHSAETKGHEVTATLLREWQGKSASKPHSPGR